MNGDKTIIFLPGSRRSEIERHSPIMSQAIEYLRSQDLKINILIATGHKQLNQIREYFPDIKVITDDNDTPVQIDNVEDFYSDISSKYFSALNEYHSEYSKLEKQRSIDGLVE